MSGDSGVSVPAGGGEQLAELAHLAGIGGGDQQLRHVALVDLVQRQLEGSEDRAREVEMTVEGLDGAAVDQKMHRADARGSCR